MELGIAISFEVEREQASVPGGSASTNVAVKKTLFMRETPFSSTAQDNR